MLALFSVDPALGRLDYDSLSDQALMEMLIAGMNEEPKKTYQDKNGNFKDIADWKFHECKDGQLMMSFFHNKAFGDTQFPFHFIPPHAKTFAIHNCNAHGTLDTSILPRTLELIEVRENKLHGPLDWASFPPALTRIDIGKNKFCGILVLSDLPEGLDEFIAKGNAFTGNLSLKGLPPKLVHIVLKRNKLSGSIRIHEYPRGEDFYIDLSHNDFEGKVEIRGEPPRFTTINVQETSMNGIIVLPREARLDVACTICKAVYDEHGHKHPMWDELVQDRWSWLWGKDDDDEDYGGYF